MLDGFRKPKFDFINPGSNDDPRLDPHAQADIALATAVGRITERHYPGHPWRIEASHAQGIVKIQLSPFMGPTQWYVIHISSMKNEFVGRIKVVRACGEILERYGMPRQNFNRDHFLHALAARPLHRKFHGFLPA